MCYITICSSAFRLALIYASFGAFHVTFNAYFIILKEALEYIRNRKTVQIIIGNRKSGINFDQNRKISAKSEKTCTPLRSIFFEEAGKTPNRIE